jgi:hypothetical protein
MRLTGQMFCLVEIGRVRRGAWWRGLASTWDSGAVKGLDVLAKSLRWVAFVLDLENYCVERFHS